MMGRLLVWNMSRLFGLSQNATHLWTATGNCVFLTLIGHCWLEASRIPPQARRFCEQIVHGPRGKHSNFWSLPSLVSMMRTKEQALATPSWILSANQEKLLRDERPQASGIVSYGSLCAVACGKPLVEASMKTRQSREIRGCSRGFVSSWLCQTILLALEGNHARETGWLLWRANGFRTMEQGDCSGNPFPNSVHSRFPVSRLLQDANLATTLAGIDSRIALDFIDH